MDDLGVPLFQETSIWSLLCDSTSFGSTGSSPITAAPRDNVASEAAVGGAATSVTTKDLWKVERMGLPQFVRESLENHRKM